MAVGLNLGSKIEIGGKSYRTLNDLLDAKAVLGKVKFVALDGNDVVYEQERQPDGTFANVNTGEIRGVKLAVIFESQKTADSVTIVDMMESEIEALGLKFHSEIELVDPVITISSIDGRDHYKIFASCVKSKESQNHQKQQNQPQPEHKQN